MNVARPYSAVSPSLDGDVLVALSRTTRPLTGRRVAEMLAYGSPDGVQKALDRLVDQGIVRREPAGRALMHTLNRDHLAAPAVEALATMRSDLLRRLRTALSSWSPPAVHASLFGSTARGDGDVDSDIDIFVVRPDPVDEEDPRWREQRERLAADVLTWTGNHAALVESSEGQLSEMARSGAPILDALRRDAISLGGTPLELPFGVR
jgi:hypothetical protein